MTAAETSNFIQLASCVALILVQTAIFSFCIGRLFQQVKVNRDNISALRDGGVGESQAKTAIEVALARLDERMGHVEEGLRDLALGIASAPPPGYHAQVRGAKP